MKKRFNVIAAAVLALGMVVGMCCLLLKRWIKVLFLQ